MSAPSADEGMLALAEQGTSRAMQAGSGDAWLRDFHAGDRRLLETVYRENFAAIVRAVSRYVSGADAESVVHEIFYRLLTSEHLRRNFAGGRFSSWLNRVASNAAIDHARRGHLRLRGVDAMPGEHEATQKSCEDEVASKVLVERFRRERLPAEWEGVFDARFLRQLPQRQAAEELGMRRTTLVYQEQRIRALLRQFLLGGEGS